MRKNKGLSGFDLHKKILRHAVRYDFKHITILKGNNNIIPMYATVRVAA